MLRPTAASDPVGTLLDQIGRRAELAGLTQEDIDRELAANMSVASAANPRT